MAAGGPVSDLCAEATCSICLDYFKDPVTITECGHNFCSACLTRFWGVSDAEASCPHCRKRVQQNNVIPNRQLRNMVGIAMKLQRTSSPPQMGDRQTDKETDSLCKKHQKPLRFFCKDHESPICLKCKISKKHKNHKVIPLEEASEEYQEQMQAERHKAVAKLRKLHQFLEEQMQLLLAQMEEVEREIASRSAKQVVKLSREVACLESSIWEMEEKCQQPASELLQDARRNLQRGEKEIFEKPMAFPPSLKWRILNFCAVNPFLESAMKQFKDNLEPALQLQKANVTLDPDTVHPKLILSKDHKSLEWGIIRQHLPNNPERFNRSCFVLGREGFNIGRHWWEVTVGNEGDWAVGVTRMSVRRKGNVDFDPQSGIWAVGKKNKKYWAVNPYDTSLSVSGELKRVQVFLDCDGNSLTFLDGETEAPLYTFSGVPSFREMVCPFFFLQNSFTLGQFKRLLGWENNNAYLRLSP
ncbi:zinc finger protein RFP-like isoform X2 [Hemicordylus capensis]|uniref:zinc finger protein RFP-like isoform X2 n=1 Tax=Hemicordylus capensis TaxID=884348 RepID=UPI0023022B80|nr:zinc finger protein RFP-like isoform X2 [Hemicordylus capensis]